jgi:N-acetyl-anhydromuramyl-L-alanine amidase AmpD
LRIPFGPIRQKEDRLPTPIVLPPLKWKPSPNFSERTRGLGIDLIVVHDTEGGYEGAVSWFANAHSQVSAHIVLKEDGSEATQMVAYSKKAWHCAAFNSSSIGLEMAGFAKKGYGEKEWAVAARIVAFLLHKHHLPAHWVRGPRYGSGFCRHYDLGQAGGGHHDPTTDDKVWEGFVRRVQAEYTRGGFRKEWGR